MRLRGSWLDRFSLSGKVEDISLWFFMSSVTACLRESRVEWQSNYIASSVYLRLFMLPRLEYRVIIFGLIKCKLPSHLQEHAITMWWSHMPLPKQTWLKIWLNTSNMMYVVLWTHHRACLLHLGYATEAILFSSSLVISLFDYISCSQRLVLLKNSYLGIPQPNPDLPRWSLVLCVWMSVCTSQPHDRVVLSIV